MPNETVVDGRVVGVDGRLVDGRLVVDDRDKKFFVANKTSAPVEVRRGGKVYVIPVNSPVRAANKEVADEVVANNPTQLRVIEQKESGRVFLRQDTGKVLMGSHDGTTHPYPSGKFVEVDTKERAVQVMGDYNNTALMGKFVLHIEGVAPEDSSEELVVDEDNKEKQFIFLPVLLDGEGKLLEPIVIE